MRDVRVQLSGWAAGMVAMFARFSQHGQAWLSLSTMSFFSGVSFVFPNQLSRHLAPHFPAYAWFGPCHGLSTREEPPGSAIEHTRTHTHRHTVRPNLHEQIRCASES